MQRALFGGAPPTNKGGIRTHTRCCFLDDSFAHHILPLLDLHM